MRTVNPTLQNAFTPKHCFFRMRGIALLITAQQPSVHGPHLDRLALAADLEEHSGIFKRDLSRLQPHARVSGVGSKRLSGNPL